MFDVSIIMPVYNVADHLPRAIESALNQKRVQCEIILVNDGSTDGSKEICDLYAKKEPLLISVIHQENQGSGPARNAGLKQATGKYIYFADPDDYFEPYLVADNYKVAQEKESDMLIFGFTQEKAGKPEDRQTHLPNIPQLPSKEKVKRHFRNVYHFTPYALWNKLYKKDFLKNNAIEFTDQRMGQDALFNIACYKHVTSIAVNRKAYYHYVTHEGSAVNRYRPDRLEMELNIATQFENLLKHWGEQEEFSDLIAEEYFHAIYLETANLVHKDCPLSQEEKIERLDTLWQSIKEKVDPHKTEEKNPFRYALLNEYKKGRPKNALRLMQTRNKAANTYGKAFNTLKSLIKA
ncbi:glycosyltransferase [Alkalibacterium iburiense]|uniref:Glycosyltransferase n=1 Tax=Alkalibacterium iburiense TaxID=290589 RepID=A0ABN0X9V1_9LACT